MNRPRLLLFQCSLSMLVDVSSMSYRESKYDELIILNFTNMLRCLGKRARTP